MESKIYECALCGALFSTASDRQAHVIALHKDGIKWDWTVPDPVVADPKDLSEDQKPMVSRADYDRARAVLDALPSGFYMKCCACSGWYTGGEYRHTPDGPLCERCR